jgi:hypothetical protein
MFSGRLSPYWSRHSWQTCQTRSKLAKPTRGPYRLIDVACQHVNGTIMVDLNHSHETFKIW